MLDLAAMNAVEGRARLRRSAISRFLSNPVRIDPIRAIIRDCGGPAVIHRASVAERGPGSAIKADAVYKWPTIGIPDRHWLLIMRLSGASADEMLSANVAARTKGAA